MTHNTTTAPPLADAGLRCPVCEYNLTGLTHDVCPECGTMIDWTAAREAADITVRPDSTEWRRWPWYLKPVGLLLTAITAALMPWRLARQLPDRPLLRAPLAFAALCLAWLPGYLGFRAPPDSVTFVLWFGSALVCLMVESAVLCRLFPVVRTGNSFRFWLTACSYACWPIPLEVTTESIPILLIGESNLWPFPGSWVKTELSTSVIFYLWCADLLIIAAVRSRRRAWWRFVAAAAGFLLITLLLSYASACLGGAIW